ncbi:endonuclease/exonuclease/phosphatase family protein [Chloracidobacterium sp. D]|uniref:endonuclease/exonuclease/phosphatase family protein n=1 Tax=Chloracidobacterium sp. D TaxID=2821536 RepID=UPI001B8C7D84|nr:endonuclease/exonuclease/phosphatase family protein [Chloracidobacterium sp. D]QUV81083.1 endonuclease/exonuclease/phosphatase family protein [Chloracidobacterium sp. D]
MHITMNQTRWRYVASVFVIGMACALLAVYGPWPRPMSANTAARPSTAAPAVPATTMILYVETFDGIGSGLPSGWTVRTGATATSLGTPASFSTTPIDWANTSGAFKNFASANNAGFNASTPDTTQNSAPDRALGIRQTGGFGDPGAAFTYQRNTTGETITAVSFDAQMLSVQPRSTTWTLQYGVGANPTSFVTLATYTDPGTWGNTNISVTLSPTQSAEVSNQPSVFFRIVALSASSGSGNRDSFGIDNFTLTGGGPPPTAPIVPSCPGTVAAFQGTTAVACGLSATDSDSIVNSAVVFSVTPPTAGFSIVDFVPATGVGGTATATLQIANTVPTGTYSVVVRWSNNDTPPQTEDCTITVNVVAATPVTPINQIQGTGNTSPLVSTVQTTEGVVYGLRSNGFFIQTPDGSALDDGNPNTSEGLFVFTGSTPPVQIGNLVRVRGTVNEFVPSADPQQPSVTQLSGSLTIARLACSVPLPAPTVITPAIASTPSPLEPTLPLRYERFEGMRVAVQHLAVVSPTGGFINETNATSTTNGRFFGVVAEVCGSGFCADRPFREPGIRFPDTVPNGGVTGTLPPPVNVPRWDANPELLRVDSTAQPGTTALNVPSGDFDPSTPYPAIVTNLVGAMDYAFRTFTILPEAANPPVFSNNGDPGVGEAIPLSVRPATDLTIASMNVQRFFDDRNDPGRSEPVLTPTAYSNRLSKFSLQVRNILRNPDVIGLQEVEAPTDNLTVVINDMAARLNTDNGNPTNSNLALPFYVGYIFPTNDVGGIAVAYLVNTNRVTVSSVTQVGATDTYVRPDSSTAILNDRPPIILQGALGGFAFTVINLHQRSLRDIDTGGSPVNGYPNEGYRVRHKRQLQAEFVANLIRQRQILNPNERMVVIGDFNGFQFNDGYADIYNTILGNAPTPPTSGANDTRVVLAPTAAWNPPTPPLVSLTGTAVNSSNYSFLFDGSAQTLDQVAVTQNLSGIAFSETARVNADFPEVDRNNAASPKRLSDHDPKRVVISVPTATPVLQNCRVSLGITGQTLLGNTCGPPNYAGDLVLTAVLTNTSTQTISDVFVQVVGLGYPDSTPTGVIVATPNPHRLLTADGATCSSGGQAGADQSTVDGQVPIGSNTPIGTLNPGESRTLTFRIALPAVRRLRFFVNVFGVGGTACPVALNEGRASGPVMATTMSLEGPAFGFEVLRDKGRLTVEPLASGRSTAMQPSGGRRR